MFFLCFKIYFTKSKDDNQKLLEFIILNTSRSISWHHRCVTILSLAYIMATFQTIITNQGKLTQTAV